MKLDNGQLTPDARHLRPGRWYVDRRLLLATAGAVALLAGLRWFERNDVEAASSFEITKSDSDWRAILTKAQYEVLRLHRTEVPGSSPLNHEQRKGMFACAGCDLPLFSSETKYDSKTGWPSFYAPLPNQAVRKRFSSPKNCTQPVHVDTTV
jgi:peptide-methionine (R)-S-oxide reductase